MTRTAYLDNASTTPVDPQVAEAMMPYLVDAWGNPSSIHAAGRRARKGIEDARETVARALHCGPFEVVFTSGGTEANNTVIRAAGGHVVTTAVEHDSILHACKPAGNVTVVPVDSVGRANPDAVLAAVRADTKLVSVMLANNEVGTLQPVAEIARRCREKGIRVHSDAVQALGKIRIDVRALGVDLLTLSSHKIHGPKGVGALFVREGVALAPLLHGGFQEFEKRAGTENVPGIVGFGKAVELAMARFDANVAHMSRLRDRLVQGLLSIPQATLHGHATERLPNIVNVTFAGIDGEALLMTLDAEGVYVSSGSACASLSLEPSHVLTAMGLDRLAVRGAVRFSISRMTTDAEVDHALAVLPKVVEKLRRLSPLYK